MTDFAGTVINDMHVGERLGRGDSGVVHAFGPDNNQWAIKFDLKPDDDNGGTLHYENMTHGHLLELQGKFIPKVPGYASRSWPSGVASNGHRYMVLERMHSPLSDIAMSHQGIRLAPIALRMLSCIKAIHDAKYIVGDVKADHFMLAYPTPDEEEEGDVADAIARRIRLVDMSKVGVGVYCTPTYASLNKHNGGTLKKKDDLEALGYVIAQIIIEVSEGSTSAMLPWGEARSDEEIALQKKNLVEDPGSKFYTAMDPAARPVMKEYFEKVRSSKFKKNEDYDAVLEILGRLDGDEENIVPAE